MKRSIVVLACSLLMSMTSSSFAAGLTLSEGVKPHKGIDGVYKTLVKGYAELDVELVLSVFAKDAYYVMPKGAKLEPGLDKIRAGFTRNFGKARKEGRQMELSFTVVRREVSRGVAYDVGTYEVRSVETTDREKVGQGTFVFAMKKVRGQWKLDVDMFN